MVGTAVSISKEKDLGMALASGVILPPVISRAGERAAERLIEFFTAHIRNANTRRAYGRVAWNFFAWIDDQNVALEGITAVHVAAWVESLKRDNYEVASVKQHLAAVRMLLDYLVTGGVLRQNPAASVKGPRHSVRRGKTPVLDGNEAGKLLDSIPADTISGLRDRALIALMTYTFARIGAAVSMKVSDIFVERNRLWVRLHEKGGKRHEMPCHHSLEEYLCAYIEGAGLKDQLSTPLFRTIDRHTKTLSNRPLPQSSAWEMVNRRARGAGIKTAVCNHTFRGTGITAYLGNGGTLERAQHMANHASTRTTQLYDRRADKATLDDVERIRLG
jgi:site-specific recombinase XerD